jgi:Predicted periplasmic lipoprotein (DUF2279)
MVRRTVVVALAMILVGRVAVAEGDAPGAPDSSLPGSPEETPAPDSPAVSGNGAGSGATGQTAAPAAAPVAVPLALTNSAPPPDDHRVVSALGLAGSYVTLGAWAWYAWYYNKPTLPSWKFGGDGWLGPTTYAGGADKFGHFWANLVFSRLGTDLLRKGGWGKLSSSLVGSGMCLAFFFGVEVKDGFYYEFSPSDMTGNTLGALLAVAMSNWPELDAALDVRVQWFPSREFRRHPNANFAEDYSGETFLFAFKPSVIPEVRDSDGPLHWLAFVNPVIGFGSRNYKPTPAPEDMTTRQQDLFFGFTLDMQEVIDETLGGRRSRAARWTHNVGHTIFEFANAPFTTVQLTGSRSPDM